MRKQNKQQLGCELLNNQIKETALDFIKTYFLDEDGEFHGDCYCVEWSYDDLLNTNFFINDYFFTIDEIYTALRYNIPREVLSAWHDTMNENTSNSKNLKNFYLLHKDQWQHSKYEIKLGLQEKP